MKTVNNYLDAVNYFGNHRVLCNKAMQLDEYWFENLRGDWFDEDGEEMPEIYQTYITDCSEDDVRYLCDWFGLLFYYSETLEAFILCVPHFGTHWSGVSVYHQRHNKSPKKG